MNNKKFYAFLWLLAAVCLFVLIATLFNGRRHAAVRNQKKGVTADTAAKVDSNKNVVTASAAASGNPIGASDLLAGEKNYNIALGFTEEQLRNDVPGPVLQKSLANIKTAASQLKISELQLSRLLNRTAAIAREQRLGLPGWLAAATQFLNFQARLASSENAGVSPLELDGDKAYSKLRSLVAEQFETAKQQNPNFKVSKTDLDAELDNYIKDCQDILMSEKVLIELYMHVHNKVIANSVDKRAKTGNFDLSNSLFDLDPYEIIQSCRYLVEARVMAASEYHNKLLRHLEAPRNKLLKQKLVSEFWIVLSIHEIENNLNGVDKVLQNKNISESDFIKSLNKQLGKVMAYPMDPNEMLFHVVQELSKE